MGTTPLGLPYPEPSGKVRVGQADIQALAVAVDERITKHYGCGAGPAGTTPLANNAWTTIAAASTSVGVGGDMVASGGTGFEYTAGDPRWFLVSGGANIAVSGTQPNGGLRVIHTTGTIVELIHSDNYQNLSAGVPVLLNAGEGVALQAWANDGSGALGGGYDGAYLRVVAL
jgi:hypothetical protein